MDTYESLRACSRPKNGEGLLKSRKGRCPSLSAAGRLVNFRIDPLQVSGGGIWTVSVMSLRVLTSSLQCNTANNADPEDVGPTLREVEQMGVEQTGDDVLNHEKRPDPTLLPK